MGDEVVDLLVLASLLESWETLKISLTNSVKDGIINMEIVKSGVLNEEMWKILQGASSSSTQSDILAVDSRKVEEVKREARSKEARVEGFCLKFRNERRKGKRDENSDNDGANIVDDFNLVNEEDAVNLTTQETSWVVDSGNSRDVQERIFIILHTR
ncbi:unnamed protein product [Linum trigynum]|uniref:Uncharacterized protein n=1 Tax=Linum trigynum TaxID=586398 RepID=A0AAV2CGZ0_9ROSI